MTQAEREAKFIWRPNDNSSTTLTRYSQEAEHWTRAFKDAERKYRPSSFKADLQVIGLFVSLVFSLLTLVVLGLKQLVKWIRCKSR